MRPAVKHIAEANRAALCHQLVSVQLLTSRMAAVILPDSTPRQSLSVKLATVGYENGGLRNTRPSHSWIKPSTSSLYQRAAFTVSCANAFDAGSRSMPPRTTRAASMYFAGVYHSGSLVHLVTMPSLRSAMAVAQATP